MSATTNQVTTPDAPMPLRCRLGWHLWSVWSQPFERAAILGTVFKQKSECLKCGARKERYMSGD